MRNWTRTLPNASYKGVPFWIEDEELQGIGRRVANHEYSKSEDHSTEDMGRKTRNPRFKAYLAGDTVDMDVQAFAEVCSSPGDGLLVMPLFGSRMVRCTNCNARASVATFGRVDLELEFVESGNNSAFSVTALGDRIAASLQGGMAAAISTAIGAFAG